MIVVPIVCSLLILYIVIGSLMMFYMVPLMRRARIPEKTMRDTVILGTIKWAFHLSEFIAVVKAVREAKK